jgi:hypothetical protein
MQNQQIRTSVKVDEHAAVPKVWLVVLGLVAAGAFFHIFMWFFNAGGMVIWPFVFAVSVLLVVNDASERNAAGFPPFQIYALFVATLVVMFVFVWMVSTINLWLLAVLMIGVIVHLFRDWQEKKERELEIKRRRLAGVCVRCKTKVSDGLEDVCPNCLTPVHQERLDLFRLAKAINMMKIQRPDSTRAVLSGSKPSRSDVKMHNLLNKPAKYKKK